MLVSNTTHLSAGIHVLDVAAPLQNEAMQRLDEGRLVDDQVQRPLDRLGLRAGPEDAPAPLELRHVDPVVLPSNPRPSGATRAGRHSWPHNQDVQTQTITCLY